MFEKTYRPIGFHANFDEPVTRPHMPLTPDTIQRIDDRYGQLEDFDLRVNKLLDEVEELKTLRMQNIFLKFGGTVLLVIAVQAMLKAGGVV